MTLSAANNDHPRVAQELLDLILDHLHHDSETLKRCALASKSLLPTCQRHLFSTFKISKSNVNELFVPSEYNSLDEQDAPLRAGIADLLNTYTTDLTLDIGSGWGSKSALNSSHLPEFRNVEKIVFEGKALESCMEIPLFLAQTWKSPSSKIKSVGFNFPLIADRGILESLYILPATVENVSFTAAKTATSYSSAASVRKEMERGLKNAYPDRGVCHLNGTMKLHLAQHESHRRLLSLMVNLEDLFKFNLKRINYQLTCPDDIPSLAALVDKCEGTLQSLDITYSSSGYSIGDSKADVEVRSFDFSRTRALRSIRIWTPAAFNPDWLSAAVSSIPKPSTATPRVPPLRVEVHISFSHGMMDSGSSGSDTPREVKKVVAYWSPVDVQLSRLISPETSGITLDISVPDVSNGPGKGIASLMFPNLSGTGGVLRLV